MPRVPANDTIPNWYRYTTGGTGQAANLATTNSCSTFGSQSGCYTMLDVGTWIKNQSTMTNVQVVSHNNDAGAIGGAALQANLFHAYALKDNPPTAYPNGYHPQEAAAVAFLDVLQSPTFQSLVTAYGGGGPMTGDAFPVVNQDANPPTCTRSGGNITLTAEMDYAPPPTPPIQGGLPVTLQKSTDGGSTWSTVATNNTNSTTGVVTFSGIALSSPGPSPAVRFRLLTALYDDFDAFNYSRFAAITSANPINDAWDPNPC